MSNSANMPSTSVKIAKWIECPHCDKMWKDPGNDKRMNLILRMHKKRCSKIGNPTYGEKSNKEANAMWQGLANSKGIMVQDRCDKARLKLSLLMRQYSKGKIPYERLYEAISLHITWEDMIKYRMIVGSEEDETQPKLHEESGLPYIMFGSLQQFLDMHPRSLTYDDDE
jgi:hypothetical protein